MLFRSAEVIILLFLSSVMHAGDPVFCRFGAGEAAMAYSCVASTDQWSAFHNQASMAYCSSFSLGVALETRYMMKEMSTRALTAIIPGKPAPLGIIMTYYGNGQYGILTGGVGSAIILTDGLSLGVQTDIISEHCAGEYKDITYITFETGLLARVSPVVSVGMHLFNPVAQFNNLPSSIRTGISWSPDKNLSLAFEALKTSGEALSIHTGISWSLPATVILRAGYSTCPSCFAFGTGFSVGRLSIDSGFLINNETGVTPSVSFLWKSGKK
jgi:hypothetical protein